MWPLILFALENGSFPFDIQYLIKFAGDTKLKAVSNKAEDRSQTQNNLDRLEYWAETNKMKYHRSKYKILYLAMCKDFSNKMQRAVTCNANNIVN